MWSGSSLLPLQEHTLLGFDLSQNYFSSNSLSYFRQIKLPLPTPLPPPIYSELPQVIFLSDFLNKVCMSVFPKSVIWTVNFTLYILITIVLLAAENKLRRRGMKKGGGGELRLLSTSVLRVDVNRTLSNAHYLGCSWKISVHSYVDMPYPASSGP